MKWTWRQRKRASAVRLTPEEKAVGRQALLSHVQAHPVRLEGTSRHIYRQPLFIFNRLKIMPAIIAIVIAALAGGGGASFAAEGAIPGDVLHSWKTEVNERVVSVLSSVSEEQKAKWEARLAERRLEETSELAKEGKLKADVVARIEANFKAQADRVRARINTFEEKGKITDAAELSSRFETSLKAHAQILERLKTKEGTSEEEQAEIEDVQEDVEDELAEVEDQTEELEEQLVEEDEESVDEKDEKRAFKEHAAAGKLKAAEHKVSEVKRFLEKAEARLGAEAVAEAKTALTAAEGLLAQGKAKFEAKEFGEAFVLGNQAIRAAQGAKLLVEHGMRLKLDLRLSEEGRAELKARMEEKRKEREERREELRKDAEERSETDRRPDTDKDRARGSLKLDLDADVNLGD
jgi:hypothetical protein